MSDAKMPDADATISGLRPIRDKLGKHGDLFMRLNGFYRIGPSAPVEPEFGYRDFRKSEFIQPIQKEAADALADLCASGQQVRALVEAAQAVVDRWDSPVWGGSAINLRHTGDFIQHLRQALAALTPADALAGKGKP